MPTATAESTEVKTPIWAHGMELTYPNDAWLDAPEVYYNPLVPNERFRAYIDRDQGLYFQHLQFANGRFVARTRVERDAVRRALGGNADRYCGDDMSKELVCPRRTCRFPTRNGAVWDDHLAATEHNIEIR